MNLLTNGAWFLRRLISRRGINFRSWEDSTGTSVANTSFSTYWLGRHKRWVPPFGWSGFQIHDVQQVGLSFTGNDHQIVTSNATYSVFLPGQDTFDANATGATVGTCTRHVYTSDRFDGGLSRRVTMYDMSRFAGSDFTKDGRKVIGQFIGLRSPSGVTGMKLVGKRAGTTVNTTVFSLANAAEDLVKLEVDLGSSPGSLSMEVQAGAGDETGKVMQLMMPFFYTATPEAAGWYWRTFAVGGWTTNSFSTELGGIVDPAGSPYTGKISDATMTKIMQLSAIPGADDIDVISLGYNDGGLTKQEHRDATATLVARLLARQAAAGLPPQNIVMLSQPDPGVVGFSSRFDDYEDNYAYIARTMSTQASQICHIPARPFLGPAGTIVGNLGSGAIFNSGNPAVDVHPVEVGANGFESLRWSAIYNEMRKVRPRGRVLRRDPA